jgi:hypothetical protein
MDGGLEQPGVPRRPALGRAERDLDRSAPRRTPGTTRCRTTRGSPRSPRAPRCAWGTST